MITHGLLDRAKWGVLLCGFLASLGSGLQAGALEELSARVSPNLADRVVFHVDPQVKDITVSPLKGERLRITAPNTRLAAAGLGCYLRTVAGAHWSWCGNRLDGPMPPPEKTFRFTPALPHTLAYNYCTLSYTMAFWGEAEWREELDRLALSGFEYLLVQAGLPEVWRRTLAELGYPAERIAAFIPDEAAAAWWSMGNLEGLGGPLCPERIATDAALGRFIVTEAHALGIKPILQGFTGLVPHDLPRFLSKSAYADARFVEQGNWVEGFVRPILLDPTTKTFQKIAALWYKHLFAVYGITAADAFAGDLFHEGGQIGGLDVTACARAVQAAQQAASPGVIWMIQAWGSNPRPALLRGLDKRYAMIEALIRDMAAGHRTRRTFNGVPWLWCELLNFGGNHGLYGGLRALADLGELTRQSGASTLTGYGLLSEGLQTNPVYYDLLLARFFIPAERVLGEEGLRAWLTDYAVRRYGLCPAPLAQAWHILADSAYAPTREQEGCTESIYCARPGWTVRKASTWSSGELYYSPAAMLRAVQHFVKAAQSFPELLRQETFCYDLADVVRQALADVGRPLLVLAHDDLAARQAFLEAIRLTDAILAQHPRWRLDTYEACARRTGGETAVRAYRRMITTWSGKRGALDDYAHRQLAGLFSGYYLKRWEVFFADPVGADAALDALNAHFLKMGADEPPMVVDGLFPVVCRALDFLESLAGKYPEAFRWGEGIAWRLEGRTGTVELDFDVSDVITEAGVYTVDIRWKTGAHALKIKSVRLYEGEKLVAEDVHAGYAGIRQEANRYSLALPCYRTGLESYTLKVAASGDGGGDSAGELILSHNAP